MSTTQEIQALSKNKNTCDHKWKFHSLTGIKSLTFRCKKCKNKSVRKLTEEEQIAVKRHWKEIHKKTEETNVVYNDFCRNFDTTRKVGAELVDAITKWAKNKPVTVSKINSDKYLVLIPHENEDVYGGTTVVYLSSSPKFVPVRLFLEDAEGFFASLKEIAKREVRKANEIFPPIWLSFKKE